MKILTVVGARPQFVKAAALSRVLRVRHREILVHTGQHYDENMSDVFFEELSIPRPDYNLGVGSDRHGRMTGRMLEGIEELLLETKPDALLVYGDTNSTLAGALAASKLRVPVVHVEAGLRSYDRRMPEEQNRIVADHLATLLSCPTTTAVENLRKEGVVQGVHLTGDVMLDATLHYRALAEERIPDAAVPSALAPVAAGSAPPAHFSEIPGPGGYYLATIHRAENTDDRGRLTTLFDAFARLDRPVVLPLHPRTLKLLADSGIRPRNVVAVEPVGYLLMLRLLSGAAKVLTDSGGLQKEAYFLRIPCVTLRGTTEWTETLADGWNTLAPMEADGIARLARTPFDRTAATSPAAFGDGRAAERIVEMMETAVGG